MGGTLYAGTYGLISCTSANPIEKKPFFYYRPMSKALTVGSFGCNFDCGWCQNFDISHTFPDAPQFPDYTSPQQLVALAVGADLRAISFSFNEPTLSAEYALDTLAIMHPMGISGNFVTNGFLSEQTRGALISAGLDAACINIKGDARVVQKYCGGNVEHVWRNAIAFARAGVHVELVTLVIPHLNDAPDAIETIAARIVADIGPDTPWHLTRFHPCWKANEMGCTETTPVEELEQFRQAGINAGLNFVYIGNVPGHPGENTYCPDCGSLEIERHLYDVVTHYVVDDVVASCHHCGQVLPVKLA
jgi:pyruvate formate lyase activating enzyme